MLIKQYRKRLWHKNTQDAKLSEVMTKSLDQVPVFADFTLHDGFSSKDWVQQKKKYQSENKKKMRILGCREQDLGVYRKIK